MTSSENLLRRALKWPQAYYGCKIKKQKKDIRGRFSYLHKMCWLSHNISSPCLRSKDSITPPWSHGDIYLRIASTSSIINHHSTDTSSSACLTFTWIIVWCDIPYHPIFVYQVSSDCSVQSRLPTISHHSWSMWGVTEVPPQFFVSQILLTRSSCIVRGKKSSNTDSRCYYISWSQIFGPLLHIHPPSPSDPLFTGA